MNCSPFCLLFAAALSPCVFADDSPAKPAGCTIDHPEIVREDGTMALKGEAKLPGGGTVKVHVDEPAENAKPADQIMKLVAEGPKGEKAILYLPHDKNIKVFLLDINQNGRPEVVITSSHDPELPPGIPPQAAAQFLAQMPATQAVSIFEWRGDAWEIMPQGSNNGLFGLGGLMGKGAWSAKPNGMGLTYTVSPKELGPIGGAIGGNADEPMDLVYELKANAKGGLAFDNPMLGMLMGGVGVQIGPGDETPEEEDDQKDSQ